MHFVFGEFEFAVPDIFVGEEFDFLEANDLGADEDIAVGMAGSRGSRGGKRPRVRKWDRRAFQSLSPCGFRTALSGGDFEDADLGVADGVGIVVDVDALDVSLALLEVEMFDVVLLPAVNVDGFFVDEYKRAGEIDFADDAGRASDVDDHEIVAGDGTQTDGIGGIGFVRPVVVFSGEMEKTSLGQSRAEIGQVDIAEFVAWRDGQFERGAFQVID